MTELSGIFTASPFGAVAAQAAVRALLASFVLGQVIAWCWELTYRGVGYSRGFSQTVVLAALASTTIVLAMSHSLVAGIGLLGVLSMVRFRASLKTPRDLVFVMAGAAAGTAAAVGAPLLALLGTAAFVLVALYLDWSPLGARARFDGVLRFRVPAGAAVEPGLSRLLAAHCRRRSLLSVGEVAQGTRVEHAYEVQLFADANRAPLIEALAHDLAATDARLLVQEAALEY
jgi:hypothetical protein